MEVICNSVGVDEADVVGYCVGALDGFGVFWDVGWEVGCDEGISVGFSVGLDVGSKLPSVLGLWLGILVGVIDGWDDGLLLVDGVLFFVGPYDGCQDGVLLGCVNTTAKVGLLEASPVGKLDITSEGADVGLFDGNESGSMSLDGYVEGRIV